MSSSVRHPKARRPPTPGPARASLLLSNPQRLLFVWTSDRTCTNARHAGEDGEAPRAAQKPAAPKADAAKPAQANNRRGQSGNEAGTCPDLLFRFCLLAP
ncbi:hypothetical protein IMZ48_09615 [Candidatus Bathyarchaeota archaeon]|nr:hypothetical protein [Candidatus Bathyarchaeota archaeon]